MNGKFLKELEDRKTLVERADFDLESKIKEQFRSYWLHITILSSAIVVGVLPLLENNSSLIKSATLAKLGILLIVLVLLLVIIYFQNALSRQRNLSYEQKQFHLKVFQDQHSLLMEAKQAGKSEDEIEKIFNDSKSKSFFQEQQIVFSHILHKRFQRTRIFTDKHFNRIISYFFILGVILIIMSFVEPIKIFK